MAKLKIKGVIIPNDQKWIYDFFGYDSTSPKDVEDALGEANGEDVELTINSGGGSVYVGSEIYTLLRAYKGKTTGDIVGVAASAASVIGMGCTTLRIAPTAQIMIHNAQSAAQGDHRAMMHSSEVLKGWNKSIANAYMLKTGMDQDKLLNLMNKETWLTAQSALEMKFVDEILFDEGHQLVASIENPLGDMVIPQKIVDRLRNTGILRSGQLNNILNTAQEGVNVMTLEEILAKLTTEERDIVSQSIATAVDNAVAEAQKGFDTEKVELQNKIDALSSKQQEDVTVVDPLASASPEIKAIIEAAQAEALQAKEALKKVENEKELNSFVNRVKAFGNLPMNAAEYGPIFMNFAKADAEGFQKLEALLTAVDNMANAAELFKNLGSGGAVTGSALDQLNAKAIEHAATNKISREKAFTAVCNANPSLYEQYLKEREGDE